MRTYRNRLLIVGTALLLALSGCASEPANSDSDAQEPNPSAAQQTHQEQDVDSRTDADDPGTSIPAGAFAASSEFPFPIPEGWEVLEPFGEEKLGKDIVVSGGVEYPGDAKDAADTYLSILNAAGFDAYTYGPGELTNQASLAAEGKIDGVPSIAILNFDVHADGYQRVSITVNEKD